MRHPAAIAYFTNKNIVSADKCICVEIHLLDSIWGAFIYQLDARYKLFQNKKIILYAKRNYQQMFDQPIKLNNWIII